MLYISAECPYYIQNLTKSPTSNRSKVIPPQNSWAKKTAKSRALQVHCCPCRLVPLSQAAAAIRTALEMSQATSRRESGSRCSSCRADVPQPRPTKPMPQLTTSNDEKKAAQSWGTKNWAQRQESCPNLFRFAVSVALDGIRLASGYGGDESKQTKTLQVMTKLLGFFFRFSF